MNKHSIRKGMLLLVLLVAVAVLGGCYMQSTDITDGTDTLGIGMGNSFNAEGATPSPSPSPSPTPFTITPNPNATGTGGQAPDSTSNTGFWETTNTNPPVNQTQQPTASPTPFTPTATPYVSPSPTPKASLSIGDKGENVRALQQQLKTLGYLTGSVDGDFGKATEDAVKEFQKVNGLTQDGKAGKNTLDKLNSSSAKEKPKATATPKPTSKPTATPSFSENTILSMDSPQNTTAKVKQLQDALISLGYLSGTSDGKFGYRTDAALRAFQAREFGANSGWDDGKAGEKTLSALYGGKGKKANSVVAHIGDSLKEGSTGGGVRATQNKLADLGYLSSSAVDGSYGAKTKSAVAAFQKTNGLNDDGIAGSATLEKMYSPNAKRNDGSSTATNPPSSTGYTTLKEGDEGEAVEKLQRRLRDLGHYTGSVDGKYGSGTKTAVEEFQMSSGLKVDGIAGPATQRAIYGDTSSTGATYATLREYDEGTSVYNLQYTLYELGYYQDRITGIYGQSTALAVREFQQNNGLKVDGVAGSDTQSLLFSSMAKPASAITLTYATLRKGDKGEEVALLQYALHELGYYPDTDFTGVYDDKTEVAVTDFQLHNGLKGDGIAGEETLRLVESDQAIAHPNKTT